MKPLSKPTEIPTSPTFREFEGPDFWLVPGYRRNLPHWRSEGATYFVTFRLADSIPAEIATRWQTERRNWLQGHSIDPALERTDPDSYHNALREVAPEARREFERSQRRQFFVELDKCHGCCALAETHGMVASALEHFNGTRLWLGDYVVMPNHVHAVAQPFPGVPLEDWLYSVKRFSAREIRAALGKDRAPLRSGHFWQSESFDRIVRDREELARTRRYIAENPSKQKLGTFALKLMDWLDEFASRP